MNFKLLEQLNKKGERVENETEKNRQPPAGKGGCGFHLGRAYQ